MNVEKYLARSFVDGNGADITAFFRESDGNLSHVQVTQKGTVAYMSGRAFTQLVETVTEAAKMATTLKQAQRYEAEQQKEQLRTRLEKEGKLPQVPHQLVAGKAYVKGELVDFLGQTCSVCHQNYTWVAEAVSHYQNGVPFEFTECVGMDWREWAKNKEGLTNAKSAVAEMIEVLEGIDQAEPK